MPYEVFIQTLSRAGVTKNAFISPITANWSKTITGGDLAFRLHEVTSDNLDAPVQEFDIVVPYIRNEDLGIQNNEGGFVGDDAFIVRDPQPDRMTNEVGQTFLTYRGIQRGISILSWRRVLWAADIDNRSKFSAVPAETLMKTLVSYNCTTLAAAGVPPAGRWRDGDLLAGMGINIIVAADQGRGNPISKTFGGSNTVLSALVTISQIDKAKQLAGGLTAGDFSLTWQGGQDWLFDWHEGQLGEDKTSGANAVIFSLDNQTLRTPTLTQRGAAATVTVSAGQGKKSERKFNEVEGDQFVAGIRDLEAFSDSRNEPTSTGRIDKGNQDLRAARSRPVLDFAVLQTQDIFWSPVPVTGRKTYDLGDLTLAQYGGDFTRKIERVSINWEDSDDSDPFQVAIDTEDTP